MTHILIWIISAVLLCLSLYVAGGNLWITIGSILKKQKTFVSFVPFVGGLVGVVGMLLLPVAGVRSFWWIPLLADLGCGPLLFAVIADKLKKQFSRGNSSDGPTSKSE
jgi:hypothetical protein